MKNLTSKKLTIFKLLCVLSAVLVTSNSRAKNLVINGMFCKTADDRAVTSANIAPYDCMAKQVVEFVLQKNDKSDCNATLAPVDNCTIELVYNDFSSTTHKILDFSNVHFSYLKRAVSELDTTNRNNNFFSESDSRDFSYLLKIKTSGLSFHYYCYC